MTTDPYGSTNNPYPVTVTAGFDGDNKPYFLYADSAGNPLTSPLRIPIGKPPYDSIRFTQVGSNTQLRLWAAATHTIRTSAPDPQGDNLLLAPGGTVAISVARGSWRGTVLIFEQLDANGVVLRLVPTPDPTTGNDG